jgi:hypothetical protein
MKLIVTQFVSLLTSKPISTVTQSSEGAGGSSILATGKNALRTEGGSDAPSGDNLGADGLGEIKVMKKSNII